MSAWLELNSSCAEPTADANDGQTNAEVMAEAVQWCRNFRTGYFECVLEGDAEKIIKESLKNSAAYNAMMSADESAGRPKFDEHCLIWFCPNEFGGRGTHRDQYRSPMLREDAFERLMRIFIQCSSDAVLPNQCFCLSNGGREIRNNLVSSFVDTGGTRLRVKERKVLLHMNEKSLEDRIHLKRMSEKGIEHETNHVHMMQTTLALPFASKNNLSVSGSTRSNVLGPFNWTPTKDYEQVQLSKISEFLGTGENAGSGHESSDDEEMKTLQRAKKTDRCSTTNCQLLRQQRLITDWSHVADFSLPAGQVISSCTC